MIDEVESLAAARQAAQHGTEPSDSLRVVNAVLTAIDMLRAKANVLIVCTSNLSSAIDAAFVDRADVKLFVGLPSARTRYAVLASAFEELQRVGVIAPPVALLANVEPSDGKSDVVAAPSGAVNVDFAAGEACSPSDCTRVVSNLVALAARNASGLSGRTLRKLPLQAHARLAQSDRAAASPIAFAQALLEAVDAEVAARCVLQLQPG